MQHIYNGDLKSDYSNSGNIRNPDFLKVVFQMVSIMVRFSSWFFNIIIKNSLGYMNHLKSGPFENRTKIDHSKYRHVRISDPHCIVFKVPFVWLGSGHLAKKF